MEKVIYALWRDNNVDRKDFNKAIQNAAPKIAKYAKAVRLNLQDEHVAGGSSPVMFNYSPHIEAAIQVWVDTAMDRERKTIDDLIGNACSHYAAWLVSETTPIPNTQHPSQEGQRTEGFSQFVFLGKPSHLSWEAWRENWQNLHTDPAIETQSNFEYHQNLVIRPLTYGAPNFTGIVEECFPMKALNDKHVYYDAVGDDEKLAANEAAMFESCNRFMDFEKIDCFPTSQYEVKKL